MFKDLGCAVWDADAAVHRLYSKGGAAVAPLRELRPEAYVNGEISRAELKKWIAQDPTALNRIEQVVHPLVAADRQAFLAESVADIVVFDIPLLFEKGSEGSFDAVVVVSAPAEVQRARVLERPGMTATQFDQILARQMPDPEKRTRADHVIDTRTLDGARQGVHTIVEQIRKTHA